MSLIKYMAAGACALLWCGALPAQAAEGYAPLFDGKSLAGWQVDPAYAKNFAVEGGVLKTRGEGGWLRSTRQYSDFVLRIEMRYLGEDPGNGRVGMSGVFLRTPGTKTYGSGWPDDSAEVQLSNRTGFRPALAGDARWAGALLLHGLEGGPTTFDTAAAMRAYGKTGEWQTVEIQAVGETVTVSINGHFVGRASIGAVRAGFIGIQAESGETEFRKIEIRETLSASDGSGARARAAGFTPLFDGTSLAGWTPADPTTQTFSVHDGAIRITGRENRNGQSATACKGNLFSDKSYADFRVRFQARFPTGLSDSGFLLRVPATTAAPGPGQAYQIQLQGMGDTSLPWNGAFFRMGDVPQGETTFDFAAAKRAYSANGEWTDFEVEAFKTWVTVRVNGVVISRAENVGILAGKFGIQCEVGVVEIRNLEIAEIAG